MSEQGKVQALNISPTSLDAVGEPMGHTEFQKLLFL